MKIAKKLTALALVLVMLATIPAALPEASAASGTAGDNVRWDFNLHTGRLDIHGTGPMWNWWSWSGSPWHGHRNSIRTVVIAPGVTTIGNHAFKPYYKLMPEYRERREEDEPGTMLADTQAAGSVGQLSPVHGSPAVGAGH